MTWLTNVVLWPLLVAGLTNSMLLMRLGRKTVVAMVIMPLVLVKGLIWVSFGVCTVVESKTMVGKSHRFTDWAGLMMIA